MENISVGRTLAVLLIGAFIAILNQTLINVAIPHLMNDFNVSTSTVQWLTTAYMLVNGVLIPITAFLIETFGTRILFLVAMSFFTAGSVICGITPNFAIMMVGRVVQAVGAGILMPLVMSVFLTVFPPEKRGAAMGMMGIAMIFAPALGPTLSGWIVESYSWRILFYMMIPLGIVDLVLGASWLKNVSKLTYPKFDLWGAVFSTLGFGGVLYGFGEAGAKGWNSLEVVLALSVGCIFVTFFVWRELVIEQPLLEFRVFTYDVFTTTTIVGSLINMSLYGGMILLPVYLQTIRGFTPLESGLLMLPGAFLMGVMSPIAGVLFDRIGVRPLAIIGLLITLITTYEFSRLTADSTYSHMLLLYTMRSFGISFIMMTVQTAGLNQLPRHLGSHGTAMSNTMRQLAGSIGTALLVTVMSTRSTLHMGSYANVVNQTNPQAVDYMNLLAQTVSVMAGIPQEAGAGLATQMVYGMAMKQATINGIDDAFIVAAVITAIALFLSFFLRRVTVPGQRKRNGA